MKKIISFIAFLLFLQAPPVLADFEKALQNYEKKEYQKAFSQFYNLAEIGHKKAQFNLGSMFLEGTGVDKDLIKAYGWIKLSDLEDQKEVDLVMEIYQQLTDEKQVEADTFYTSLKETLSEEALKTALEPIYKNTDKSSRTESKRKEPEIIKWASPLYPREASYKGVEGWVTFRTS